MCIKKFKFIDGRLKFNHLFNFDELYPNSFDNSCINISSSSATSKNYGLYFGS